jgi:hypothetical protein
MLKVRSGQKSPISATHGFPSRLFSLGCPSENPRNFHLLYMMCHDTVQYVFFHHKHWTMCPVAEFFIIRERFGVFTRQLQAAEVRSKLSTMNDKSSFVKSSVSDH